MTVPVSNELLSLYLILCLRLFEKLARLCMKRLAFLTADGGHNALNCASNTGSTQTHTLRSAAATGTWLKAEAVQRISSCSSGLDQMPPFSAVPYLILPPGQEHISPSKAHIKSSLPRSVPLVNHAFRAFSQQKLARYPSTTSCAATAVACHP